jgi:hypothetical protein
MSSAQITAKQSTMAAVALLITQAIFTTATFKPLPIPIHYHHSQSSWLQPHSSIHLHFVANPNQPSLTGCTAAQATPFPNLIPAFFDGHLVASAAAAVFDPCSL